MKKLILILALIAGLVSFTAVPASALSSTALQPAFQFAACTNGGFLTFPAWYRGLTPGANCAPTITDLNQIWIIALNIIEIGMQIAGYAALGLLIWGGVQYISSQGEPQRLTAAKSTILNAIIGLGIVLASVAIVNFIATRFAG